MPGLLYPSREKPPLKPAHVLFFAVRPPQEIRDQIAAAWRRSDIQGKFRDEVLHVTIQGLVGLDDVPERLVELLRRVGAGTRASGFELCFDRVETFGGRDDRRPIVLSTDRKSRGANDLAIAIRRELARAGFPAVDTRKVEPHVTMTYADARDMEKLVQPIRWRVTDFSLIDSVQGFGRHIVLGTWPLNDDEDTQPSLF